MQMRKYIHFLPEFYNAFWLKWLNLIQVFLYFIVGKELTLWGDVIYLLQYLVHIPKFRGKKGKEVPYMKSTGIVRKVDELGRIVLPIELRRTLDIAEKDSLEIYVDGTSIVLKKYQPACVFCDSADGVVTYKGKNVCSLCIKELDALS